MKSTWTFLFAALVALSTGEEGKNSSSSNSTNLADQIQTSSGSASDLQTPEKSSRVGSSSASDRQTLLQTISKTIYDKWNPENTDEDSGSNSKAFDYQSVYQYLDNALDFQKLQHFLSTADSNSQENAKEIDSSASDSDDAGQPLQTESSHALDSGQSSSKANSNSSNLLDLANSNASVFQDLRLTSSQSDSDGSNSESSNQSSSVANVQQSALNSSEAGSNASHSQSLDQASSEDDAEQQRQEDAEKKRKEDEEKKRKEDEEKMRKEVEMSPWVAKWIRHSDVRPFPQPEPMTVEEKVAVMLKPELHVTNGCHPYPAVNDLGETSGGLKTKGAPSGMCKGSGLGSQVYGRQASFRGVWAIMYTWYFPKDMPSAHFGHRHDWENIIVWIEKPVVKNVKILAVTPSAHDGYSKQVPPNPGHLNGLAAKINYESKWPINHALEPTGKGGEKQDLILWEQMSSSARHALNIVSWGAANTPFNDFVFMDRLEKAFPL